MDLKDSNEDELKSCTVLSSPGKTAFDTIAFTVPKKESATSPNLLTPPPADPCTATPTVAMSKTSSMVSMLADDLQIDDQIPQSVPTTSLSTKIEVSAPTAVAATPSSTSHIILSVDDEGDGDPLVQNIFQKLENLELNDQNAAFGDSTEAIDTPPVASAEQPENSQYTSSSGFQFQTIGSLHQKTTDNQSSYSQDQVSNVANGWIPSEETKTILANIGPEILSGTYVPDKLHMTMPGISLEDELIDKVTANVSRIFGSPEASRRKTFTADNVTQDENGLRELIKLGCYRAAINLTKRLLVLYGQGPGKVGHYSKHTPQSLQLWFTRISLLVRIREFSVAESELEAFNNFKNPDMYYDYYPGSSRTGSMVPFHFRLLAAEVPQYMRKFNETINKLYLILYTVQLILENLQKGLNEDGSSKIDLIGTELEEVIGIWKKREIRVLYSLANSSLFAKDYYNAFNFLNQLCLKDSAHVAQLKSALGRLYLQHGDISSAEMYFLEASELRSPDLDSDQVDTLVDSALLSISQSNYVEAIEFLKQGLMIQPENFMITNNLAVCHLYLGNLKESLALMETTVKQNMPQSLQENVILNLCSIYELENSDGSKKLGLLKLINEYKGDGINLASLKIPELI